MSTPLEDGTIANGDVIETIHLSQLFPIVEALENNQTNYREDIGVADAYKVEFDGSLQANEISAYQAGQQIVFKAANANTGPSTLQVVGPSGDLSALPLTKNGGADLEAGDIQSGQMVLAIVNDEGSGRFDALGVLTGGGDEVVIIQDGSTFYREDDGVANAYQVDASGSGSNPLEIAAYAPGQVILFKAENENTGASTLQVIGSGGALSVKNLTKFGSVPLEAGDIQAGQMVMAVYNDDSGGRFEMMDAPTTIPVGGGGGGGGSIGAVANQVFRSTDLQIFATNQTDLPWQYFDVDEGMDAYNEWLISEHDGFYEVSLSLNMDFPVDETLTIEMFKGNGFSWSGFSRVEFDLPAGLQLINLPPMLVQLNEGDRIKWMLTSANGDPTVLSGDRRSRCTINQIGGGSGSSSGGAGSWLYGDGMDGDGYLDYDQDFWEHKYYRDLYIDYGVTICTNGYKLHVSGTLTNNGTIHNNGTDGTPGVGPIPGDPGHGRNYGQLAWEGHWGGAGSLQSGETVYYVDEQAYFARGGDGGSGSYGTGGSGDGGNLFGSDRFFMAASAFLSGIYDGDAAWHGARTIGGGMGGGGGTGDDDDAAGGGGGGSGSILWIAARALEGDGEVQSRGGNGGDAGGADAGGGGGGGGGIIYLLTDAATSPYTYNVDGGNGGFGGGGSGYDGGSGNNGLYVFRGSGS